MKQHEFQRPPVVRMAEFAMAQANRALDYTSTVDEASRILTDVGLPHHEDRVKNWDNLIAVHAAVGLRANNTGIVLDAGGGKSSAFLPGLVAFGVTGLLALNTDFRYPEDCGGVSYRRGDATDTGLEAGSVDVYACLSVVEHGVDEARLAAEAARLLSPGGLAIISTDYWQDPVDTRGQYAFGVPVKVYDLQGITRMLDLFEDAGLKPVTAPNFNCRERTVNWIGMDYTFVNLLLRKE